MMQGYVNANYEAVIPVVIKNKEKTKSIRAIIDTGFTGFLSLPQSIIDELNLPWRYRNRATLGDGSETLFDIYSAMSIWNGEYCDLEVNSAETEPLIGMQLLRGYRLQIDNVEGGLVIIEKL